MNENWPSFTIASFQSKSEDCVMRGEIMGQRLIGCVCVSKSEVKSDPKASAQSAGS